MVGVLERSLIALWTVAFVMSLFLSARFASCYAYRDSCHNRVISSYRTGTLAAIHAHFFTLPFRILFFLFEYLASIN